MPQYPAWWSFAFYGCLIVLVLILIGPGLILGIRLSKKFQQELQVERDERNKQNTSIFENGGVLAPAVIISARKVKSWGGGKNSPPSSFVMDFEVEVTAENAEKFVTSFRNELYRDSYVMAANEMITERGKKIWVTYDPKDTSRAYLDHFDEDHESAMKEREIDIRRAAFNKLTSGNDELKASGESAEAIITRVDDLDLPYPLKKSRALHLYFDVRPAAGFPFQAQGDVLIVETSLQKYSVGKKIYVRYDSQNPTRAVLDSERNKYIK